MLAGLMKRGAWGKLRSQVPIVTPQVCRHARHRPLARPSRVDGFLAARVRTRHLRETHGSMLQAPAIWQLLGERGLSSAGAQPALHLPAAEAERLHDRRRGCAGRAPFDRLSARPAQGGDRAVWPLPPEGHLPGGRRKPDYLELIDADVQAQTDVFAHLLATRIWHFGLVFFSHAAICQHYFWEDMASNDSTNPYRGLVESAYRALDMAVWRLMEAAGEDTNVIVMSDCGAGPLYAGVNLNTLLAHEGFLSYQPEPARRRTHEVTFPERVRRSALARLRTTPWYFQANHYLQPVKAWMRIEARRLGHRLVAHAGSRTRPMGTHLHQPERSGSARHGRPRRLRPGVRGYRGETARRRGPAAHSTGDPQRVATRRAVQRARG